MGWLKDIWDAIIGWIADQLRFIVEAITGIFTNLLEEFRFWKHRALQVLGEWMKNDLFFIGFVGSLVLVGVFLPSLAKIWTALVNSSIVKRIVAFLKSEIVSLFNVRIAIDLKAISDMLKIVWPEWRKATDSVNALLAAWAEELGQGSGFIHAYMACAYAIESSVVTTLGLDPHIASMEWYGAAAERVKIIDARFQKYAHHPEQIFTDIIDEWLIPMAEDESEARGKELEEAERRWKRVLEIDRSLIDAKESIDLFVESLPEELRGEFDKRWAKFSEDFDKAMAGVKEYILDKMQSILDILAEREGRLTELEKAIWRNARHPALLIAASEEWTPAEKNLWAEFIYASVIQKRGEEQAEGVEGTFDTTDEALDRLDRELAKIKPTPAMSYEPPGISVPAETAGALKEDWFVGEY